MFLNRIFYGKWWFLFFITGDLIEKYGPKSSEPNLVCLLEVLIAVPEELHGRSFKIGQARRESFKVYSVSCVSNILNLLVSIGFTV